MIHLRVDARNLRALEKAYGDRARRQLPFATALALTRTAQAAQRDLREDLPERFTLRRPHVARGVRIQAANKINLTAAVGTIDWYMGQQVTGAVRRPRTARHIAQPTDAVRPTKTARIPRSKRPRALRGKPGTFVRPIGSGKKLGVFVPKGRARVIRSGPRAGQKARPVRLAYVLRRRQRIAKRWNMRASVAATARREFPRAFERALGEMLARELVPPARRKR